MITTYARRNGALAAIPFEVLPATTEARQALHQRHLAWERFVSDDPAGAVACVREADRLDPANTDPIAEQSRFEVVEPGLGVLVAAVDDEAVGLQLSLIHI